MRIAMLVSAAFPPREGMGFYVWNLSRQLSRLGHTVHIITRGGRTPRPPQILDGLTIWRPPFLPLYPLHVHLHTRFVDQLLRQLQPELDVLHLHTPLVRFPRTSLPALVTVHTPMKADAASIPTTSFIGLLVRLQLPVSVTLESEIFRRAGRVVAVASSVAGELGAYGIDPRTVGVLGNGVDTDFFTPAPQDQRLSPPYFFTAGRLGPRKGLEDLVECAALVSRRFPQVRFLVAGAGAYESSLRARIARRGLQQTVILLGHISDRHQMLDLYRRALAYVHPAHYEGLPTVVLEAMACGTPVVATAVSGALDVIQDGANGLLVPPRSPARLAETLGRLLEQPTLGERLSQAALQTIHERYAWSVVSRSYLAEYERLCNGRRR